MRISFTPKQYLILLLTLILVLYVAFQARFIIVGPMVRITSPKNGASVSGQLVVIEGVAKNAAWLSFNDRQIFTDEKGLWSEKLIAAPGLSIISVRAKDRFGRETTKTISIFNPTT